MVKQRQAHCFKNNKEKWGQGSNDTAFGPDKTWKLCKAINRIPPLTLRVNTRKTDRSQLSQALTRADLEFEMTPMSSDGICLSQPGTRVTDLPGYDLGWFQVQDEAAQLVSHIVAPRPGERILDACAGLGGKAFHMAQPDTAIEVKTTPE